MTVTAGGQDVCEQALPPCRAQPTSVAIRGHGIAAHCCARLLVDQGIAVQVDAGQRPRIPALLLSDPALALLRDVTGRPALLAGEKRVARRIVCWGGEDPVVLPHEATIISEAALHKALGPIAATPPAAPPDFTIHATVPFPSGEPRYFGRRRAAAAQVGLRNAEDDSACWIEAVDTGWLFLVPAAPGSGWLLAIGGTPAGLLAQSRHLGHRVTVEEAGTGTFDAVPRLLERLQGPDWLACGTAAIGFDPICGDGTAQAVREAILAAAVIAGMAEAGESESAELRLHYESMLIAGMRRHLRLCAQFYQSGGQSDWWRRQTASLVDGFDWCSARLARRPEPAYRLEGFRLVRQERVAA